MMKQHYDTNWLTIHYAILSFFIRENIKKVLTTTITTTPPKRTKSKKENHESSNISTLKLVGIKIILVNKNYKTEISKIYYFCRRYTK